MKGERRKPISLYASAKFRASLIEEMLRLKREQFSISDAESFLWTYKKDKPEFDALVDHRASRMYLNGQTQTLKKQAIIRNVKGAHGLYKIVGKVLQPSDPNVFKAKALEPVSSAVQPVDDDLVKIGSSIVAYVEDLERLKAELLDENQTLKNALQIQCDKYDLKYKSWNEQLDELCERTDRLEAENKRLQETIMKATGKTLSKVPKLSRSKARKLLAEIEEMLGEEETD